MRPSPLTSPPPTVASRPFRPDPSLPHLLACPCLQAQLLHDKHTSRMGKGATNQPPVRKTAATHTMGAKFTTEVRDYGGSVRTE